MTKIVPNSTVGSGNTQITEPTTKPVQKPGRVHHFFTWNNYDSSDINILKHIFKEYCYMYAFQEEIGKSGTRHLQGVCSCKKKMRDTEFKLPKKIHWEKVIDVKASYIYCTKEESRSGKVYVLNYKIPYQFKLKNFYNWEEDILEIIKKEANCRDVYWFWSEKGGIGKSTFCKHLVMNKNAIFLSKGKYSDIINVIYKSDMMSASCVVIDLPKNCGNRVSYNAIEAIKNGLICNTKFETGYCAFPPKHVIVFANAEPEYELMMDDRWKVKKLD